MSDQSKAYLQELLKLNKYNLVAFAYEKIIVTGTAISLNVPVNARYADITLESSITASVPVRYLMSGVPTATDGKALNHLTVFDVSGTQNLINFKAIQTTAGTHTLYVEYYK